MTAPFPLPEDQSDLRQAVLDWFVCRQRDGWSTDDEAAFQRWLAADARHREAYARWESNWRALDGIPAESIAQLRRNLQDDKARVSALRARTPAKASRRGFLKPVFAMAAAAAVAGGLAWHFGQESPVFAQTYASLRGQQLDIPLPDGSRLQLDTATRIQVAFYRQRREVTLLEGQAVFSVQPDPARLFHVLAGPLGVTVVGTQFSLRYTPDIAGNDGVRLSVAEGQVRVVRRDGASGEALHRFSDAIYLTAGQQVSADSHGVLAAVTAVSSEGIAPWRDSRISFVDTPLAQALAELERYGSTGLTVRDPKAAMLRLSGTFDPRDMQTLRRLLPSALPVRLKAAGEAAEIVPER
jgi:transmembrane sensor